MPKDVPEPDNPKNAPVSNYQWQQAHWLEHNSSKKQWGLEYAGELAKRSQNLRDAREFVVRAAGRAPDEQIRLQIHQPCRSHNEEQEDCAHGHGCPERIAP